VPFADLCVGEISRAFESPWLTESAMRCFVAIAYIRKVIVHIHSLDDGESVDGVVIDTSGRTGRLGQHDPLGRDHRCWCLPSFSSIDRKPSKLACASDLARDEAAAIGTGELVKSTVRAPCAQTPCALIGLGGTGAGECFLFFRTQSRLGYCKDGADQRRREKTTACQILPYESRR